MAARVPRDVPRVSWDALSDEFYETWGYPDGRPEAEHVAVIGPTGSGKTMLVGEIVATRAELRESHVVVIATKPADGTLLELGWPVIRAWPPGYGQSRVIFWPRPGKPSQGVASQRVAIRRLLDELWVPNSNRIVVFDEISYLEQDLRLEKQVRRYWREARSLGITIVAGTQRPRAVSRHMFSEPSWVFIFKPTDEDEGRRLAEVAGSKLEMLGAIAALETHEFLVVRTRTREMAISRL